MTDASTKTMRWEVAAVEAVVRPRSIAIVGVSSRAGSAGHMVLANLVQNEFRGDIHLVGRSVANVEGRACLASIDDLPENIDLAVFTVPAGAVAESVAACVRRKVKSAITFASGFAEMGEDERARQREIGAVAQQGHLALVGPNCLGYTNYVDGLCIGFMGFPRVKRLDPAAGPGVAVIAQSGGMGGHVIGALEARNVPVSYSITVGNEAGIGLAEFIEHLAGDPSTGIILAYGEQIRRPDHFLAAAAAARAQGKHVILFHPGRSVRAQAAARSHTGALAGDHAAMRTAVQRAGVVLVETLEEMIDVGHLLLRYPVPPTAGAGVLTFSGALCAIAQDYCETLALDLPPMSGAQKDKLRPNMEAFNPPENPLDMGTITAWKPDLVRLGAQALMEDPQNGSLVVSIPGHSSPVGAIWVERTGRGAPAARPSRWSSCCRMRRRRSHPRSRAGWRRTGWSCCARRSAAFARWRGSPPMAGASPPCAPRRARRPSPVCRRSGKGCSRNGSARRCCGRSAFRFRRARSPARWPRRARSRSGWVTPSP